MKMKMKMMKKMMMKMTERVMMMMKRSRGAQSHRYIHTPSLADDSTLSAKENKLTTTAMMMMMMMMASMAEVLPKQEMTLLLH